MKNLFVLFLFITGCGYSARNSTFTAQVKYVENVTPIICSDFISAGMSLGVTRNGTGSVSTHDITVLVPDKSLAEQLKTAASEGKLVKITYDDKRLAFCVPNVVVVDVEVLQ